MTETAATERACEHARALELVRTSSRFVLCGHVRPDGDCVGAQAAMSRVLQKLGKQVWIYNADPLQPQFDYLAREVEYRTFSGGELPRHDVSVMLDFCEITRTGPMQKPLESSGSKKLVVDHHLFHGTPWWDAAYVDPRAAATGLLVLRMARALGVELDLVAAQGVFTSLVTDTGWFKYSNTDAETLTVAGELTALGVDPSRIYNAIYQRQSREQPHGLARALQRLEYFAEGRLAVIDLPKAAAGEADLADGDDLLDLLRSVAKVEVVLFLREVEHGAVKLSARSKTGFDVNQLARRFGGGGHAKASGATFAGERAAGLADVRARVVAAALEQLGPERPKNP